MTEEQKAHAKSNIKDLGALSYKKYVAGQKEHGGHLWLKKGMLHNIEQETADLIQYIPTLRQQLNVVLDLLVTKKYIEAENKLIEILSAETD